MIGDQHQRLAQQLGARRIRSPMGGEALVQWQWRIAPPPIQTREPTAPPLAPRRRRAGRRNGAGSREPVSVRSASAANALVNRLPALPANRGGAGSSQSKAAISSTEARADSATASAPR